MPRNRWLSLTRHAAALLALGAFCGLGCIVSNVDPKDPPAGKQPDTLATPVDTIDVPQAFFTLDGTDLRRTGWPADFAKYSLFVCTPSLGADEIAKIHQGVPGTRALSYVSAQDVSIGFFPGNPYYDTLTATFDSTLCLRDLRTGNVVRQRGESGSALPAFILSKRTADLLVAFLQGHMAGMGWDGLYVDQCTSEYPAWRKALLDSLTTSFDIDGDGVADTMDQLDAQYAAWRPYFTQRLREVLGNDAILVANAGGPLVDSALNGITLEGVGTRFTVPDARGYLHAQLAVARPPFVAALWITTDGSREPSLGLAREIAGVHYGTVAYFQ
ncbi:MAG: hypothetical protein U0167_05195 [bacterium]